MVFNIKEEQIKAVRDLKRFRKSIYHNLDIRLTLEYFTKRFVTPLSREFDIRNSIAVDCGAGYGWFSLAYLLAGGKGVIAIDVDKERLKACKEILEIFSVSGRAQYIVSNMLNLPLSSQEVDLFVTIETLEHVGKKRILKILKNISEVARRGILLTTPNKLFPVIMHDTRIPFIHWIAPRFRLRYSALFGRKEMDDGNEFISPFDLQLIRDQFRPMTSCLACLNYREFLNMYPLYFPYGSNENSRYRTQTGNLRSIYYRIAAFLLGKNSYWIMPNLACIFKRK